MATEAEKKAVLDAVFTPLDPANARIQNVSVGRSCWYIEGRTCPVCGGQLATEGRVEWCVNVNSGQCKPPNDKLSNGPTP